MLNKPLSNVDIELLINPALDEDIHSGDITTRNILDTGQLCEAEFIAKDTLIPASTALRCNISAVTC